MTFLRTVLIATLLNLPLHAQAKDPSASDASAAIVAGGSVAVYATINNPTMYDVFVMSAASDQAGKAALREGDKTLPNLTVPAYGSLELKAAGPLVLLSELKGQLKAGDTVKVTLTTDGGLAISLTAVVK
jgi:copper(I)-binding protein